MTIAPVRHSAINGLALASLRCALACAGDLAAGWSARSVMFDEVGERSRRF